MLLRFLKITFVLLLRLDSWICAQRSALGQAQSSPRGARERAHGNEERLGEGHAPILTLELGGCSSGASLVECDFSIFQTAHYRPHQRFFGRPIAKFSAFLTL